MNEAHLRELLVCVHRAIYHLKQETPDTQAHLRHSWTHLQQEVLRLSSSITTPLDDVAQKKLTWLAANIRVMMSLHDWSHTSHSRVLDAFVVVWNLVPHLAAERPPPPLLA